MPLRIAGGKFKNIRLESSQDARPVRERVKLAIFSIIDEKIANADILDLYAGSGNLGFEAISRGGKSCVFIDSDYYSIFAIKNNYKKLKSSFPNEIDGIDVRILKEDAVKYVTNVDEHYDLIFLDPPYKQPVKHILKYVSEMISENGMIIYSHAKSEPIDINTVNNQLKIVDTRSYGITMVDFITKT